MDGEPGRRGCDIHQELPAGLRVAEGGGGAVRGDLPDGAPAPGPADPEDPPERGRRRRPLCAAGQAPGAQRQAGL